MRLPTVSLVLLALFDVACASAPAPQPVAQATSHRRRRRRRHRPAPEVAANAVAPTPATDAAVATAGTPDTSPSGVSGDLRLVPTVRASASASGAVSGGFGSPTVHREAAASELRPRWVSSRSRPRLRCEGDATPQRASPQSPLEPTVAMIVRVMAPAEAAVLACRPPMNAEGRLPVHALFSGRGAPEEISFPGVDVSAATAECLGAALCGLRMPAFRTPQSAVDYRYVVAVPE